MPRIEIELTSSRPDGSWTWRAAGARQPKGILDGAILPSGSKVGDVMRAEVEVELDGMTVTAVTPPKTKREAGSRLEILGPPGRDREAPGVTASPGVSLTGEGGDRRRRGGPGRDRAGAGTGGRSGTERPRAGRPGAPGGPGPGGPAGDRRPGGAGGERRPGGRPPGDRVAGGRPSSGPRTGDRSGPPRERSPRPTAPAPPPRPRPKRLNPGRAHREAVLASLPPEELPIAEQILRGGVPAVRQALEEQNAAARAAGSPEVRADALLALAERLAPRLRAAEWLDRAEAAVAHAEEVALRDLRALVAGSDAVGRDETGRELAGRLREVLDERSAKERDLWLGEVTEALEAGRVVRALRASGRPPEPGARFPAPLAERLSEAANAAMSPDVAPDRWAAVLDAVTASPVRRIVKPQGLPAEAPPELVRAARQAADRVPGLVPLVGAPQQPSRPPRKAATPGGGAAAGASPARRRPPVPPRPATGGAPGPARRRGPAPAGPAARPTGAATEGVAPPAAPSEPPTAGPGRQEASPQAGQGRQDAPGPEEPPVASERLAASEGASGAVPDEEPAVASERLAASEGASGAVPDEEPAVASEQVAGGEAASGVASEERVADAPPGLGEAADQEGGSGGSAGDDRPSGDDPRSGDHGDDAVLVEELG